MAKTKTNTETVHAIGEDNVAEALDLVNQHTIKKLTSDDVFMFKVHLCDNDVDRSYDKMSLEFLNEFAEASKSLTGLKDHEWEMENQVSRLYDTEIVTNSDKLTHNGDPLTYVLGKAYTLRKFEDYVDKINAGILKEVSIGFESDGDTCSICGGPTVKDENDLAHCEKDHVAGQTYDGVLCYNNLNKLSEAYEWSLVAVPCQKNSGIKNKNIKNGGSGLMKKGKFILHKLFSTKAFKDADKDTQDEMQKAVEDDGEGEMNDEDIKSILTENSQLKEKIADLESKFKDAEGAREQESIKSIVGKAVDGMNPLTPTVKENILRDMNLDGMKMVDGQVPGLDDLFKSIKSRYKGLVKDDDAATEDTETDEQKEEGEGDKNDVDDKDEDKQKSVKGVQKGVSKSVKQHNSGISFGVGATKSVVSNAKSGLSFS